MQNQQYDQLLVTNTQVNQPKTEMIAKREPDQRTRRETEMKKRMMITIALVSLNSKKKRLYITLCVAHFGVGRSRQATGGDQTQMEMLW